MLDALARFVFRRRVPLLIAAVLIAAGAGAVGAGVAERLDPYSAEDPSTESVSADRRFERSTGAAAEAGVIAVITPGEGRIASPRLDRRARDAGERAREAGERAQDRARHARRVGDRAEARAVAAERLGARLAVAPSAELSAHL